MATGSGKDSQPPILRVALAASAATIAAVLLAYLSRVYGADAEASRVEFLPMPSASESRILAALDESTTMEFEESSLQNAVNLLADRHGIPIRLDVKTLADAGVGSDTLTRCRLKGVRLKSALHLLLGEMDLAYLIQDDVLLITSKDKAEQTVVTRTYPVGDLIEEEDYDALIDAITSTVRPQTWDEVGGPGSICPVSSAKCLVVSQTREAHDDFLVLLRALRAARRVSEGGAAPAK